MSPGTLVTFVARVELSSVPGPTGPSDPGARALVDSGTVGLTAPGDSIPPGFVYVIVNGAVGLVRARAVAPLGG